MDRDMAQYIHRIIMDDKTMATRLQAMNSWGGSTFAYSLQLPAGMTTLAPQTCREVERMFRENAYVGDAYCSMETWPDGPLPSVRVVVHWYSGHDRIPGMDVNMGHWT